MNEIKAVLKEKIKRTDAVASFRFEIDEKINFSPGQFMEVILDKENKDLKHYLSFSSSPARDYVEFTKRISDSAFCKKLMELKEGDEVLLKLPLGDCVYKEEYGKIGFLIGGVGITPVISMLEHISDKNLNTDAVLFYSNRREGDIAFKEQLDEWREKENIEVIYFVTAEEPQDKSIKFTLLNADVLKQYQDRFLDRVFFIFGPPKMVDALFKVLKELGVAEEKIKTEKFLGY